MSLSRTSTRIPNNDQLLLQMALVNPQEVSKINNKLLWLSEYRGECLDVYLISSSGQYFTQMSRRSFFQRISQFHIIQPQNNPEKRRQQIEKILAHFSKGGYKKVVDYLVEKGHSLRRVVQEAQKTYDQKTNIQLDSEEKFLDYLARRDQRLSTKIKTSIDQAPFNKNLIPQIIRAILKQNKPSVKPTAELLRTNFFHSKKLITEQGITFKHQRSRICCSIVTLNPLSFAIFLRAQLKIKAKSVIIMNKLTQKLLSYLIVYEMKQQNQRLVHIQYSFHYILHKFIYKFQQSNPKIILTHP